MEKSTEPPFTWKPATMDLVLMSIKPNYADAILAGTKRWEFRRKSIRKMFYRSVLIYATAPVSKVVGQMYFEIEVCGNLNRVWDIVEKEAGLTLGECVRYYGDTEMAYAGRISRAVPLNGPTLEKIRKGCHPDLGSRTWRPPQSWMEIKRANPVFWGF